MSIGLVFVVIVACGIAATARYGLSLLASPQGFPWPTVVANVLGTAVLASALAAYEVGAVGAEALAVLGLGFAGGLTTFSSLAGDAVRLWRAQLRGLVWGYLAASLGLGLLASWAAWTVTAALLS